VNMMPEWSVKKHYYKCPSFTARFSDIETCLFGSNACHQIATTGCS
jgi:hypothetical protein